LLLQIQILGIMPGGQETKSKMTLIDLAGSERLSKSGATGELQKEVFLFW